MYKIAYICIDTLVCFPIVNPILASPKYFIESTYIDIEDKLGERIVLSGQNRETILINESGLYSLDSIDIIQLLYVLYIDIMSI